MDVFCGAKNSGLGCAVAFAWKRAAALGTTSGCNYAALNIAWKWAAALLIVIPLLSAEAKQGANVNDYSDFTLRLEESFPQSDRLKVVKKWMEERKSEPALRPSPGASQTIRITLKLPALFDPDGQPRSQALAILKNLADSSSVKNLQLSIPGSLPTAEPAIVAWLDRLQKRRVVVIWQSEKRSPSSLRRDFSFYPKILDIRQSPSFRNDPTGDWIMGLADSRRMRNQLRGMVADLVVDDRIVLWPTPTLGFREFEAQQASELRYWFAEIRRLQVKDVIIPIEFDQTSIAPRGIDWYTRDLNTRGLFRADGSAKPAWLVLTEILERR